MSKRGAPEPSDEDDELDVDAPPTKIARKMSVDELVVAVTTAENENDASMLSIIVLELFTNVIETWNVRDWLAFTRITASWSGLRQPEVAANYIHVWRGLVMRDFSSVVRERSGLGAYRFIRNIEWLWLQKRNHPTKPYPRPSLRDFWRRAYFAANKHLHYLLGASTRLTATKVRPDAGLTAVFPDNGIIPDDFRPWINPREMMNNRIAAERPVPEGLGGMPSMNLAPHSIDLSALVVDGRGGVAEGSTAYANTTAFTKWTQSRYHASPVRLGTQGMPSPFVVVAVRPTDATIGLTERHPEGFDRLPALRLAYAMTGPGMVSVTSVRNQARPGASLELARSESITDLWAVTSEAPNRILIGRAVPLAEYHTLRHQLHTIETSIGLRAVDAESFIMASINLLRVDPERMGMGELATTTGVMMFYLARIEDAESRGNTRMRYHPYRTEGRSRRILEGIWTHQLDGWPLFLQLCFAENPEELRQRPRRTPARGYFDSLTSLFRNPPEDQAHLDPFRTMPEPPLGAVAGPPRFILFDCSICRSAKAVLCNFDKPTLRYCAECAVPKGPSRSGERA